MLYTLQGINPLLISTLAVFWLLSLNSLLLLPQLLYFLLHITTNYSYYQ
jgi:hypothetical protein